MKRLAQVAVLVALVVTGCGDDDATTTTTTVAAATTSTTVAPATTTTTVAATTTTEAAGAGAAVTVEGFAFVPADLTVAVGTTVTWTNQDGFGHTATADDDAWDGFLPAGGGSFAFTFDTAGTYSYLCTIHPSMTGTITVEG